MGAEVVACAVVGVPLEGEAAASLDLAVLGRARALYPIRIADFDETH